MFRKRKPPSERKAQIETIAAPLNGGERKKRRSISGSGWRLSQAIRLTRATAAPAKQPRIRSEPQPWFGASMIPKTRRPRVAIISSCPSGSTRRGCGAFDSGTNLWVRTIAAIPTGMLIQKTARQSIACTRSPPINGPAAMLMPATPPHQPIARALSFGSVKTLVTIDIATGFSMLPPIACIARKAISQPRPGAMLQRPEPTVKIVRPTWKVRRRPSRSPIDPDSISRQAITSV